jgi:ribosomal subunit interface protein
VEITVSARHIDISPALRAAAEEKFGRLSRFGAGLERVEVHFVEEQNRRIAAREVCEVTVEGRGGKIHAHAAASDPIAAIDLAVEKLAHQLVSKKTKVVARRHATPRGVALAAVEDV